MVVNQHDRGRYRYVPQQGMSEMEFKEKLEKVVNLIAGVCIPDEIKQARLQQEKMRAKRGTTRNR